MLNTFIFFLQKLYYQKSNETHFNKKQNINEIILYNNKNCNNEFFQYLKKLKENCQNLLQDIYIKNNLNFIDIINGLFKNDFEKLILIKDENNEKNIIEEMINDYIKQHNNILIIENNEIKSLKNDFKEIKSNKSLLIAENIIKNLNENKKYHQLIEELKSEKEQKDKIYEKISQKLINFGGFNKSNFDLIIQIIKKYFNNYKKICDIEDEMKNLSRYSLEYSQILLEIKQLNEIKEYFIEQNKEIQLSNKNFELNKMENIKKNFKNNLEIYKNETNDNKFKEVLNEINNFIENNSIKSILESVKQIFSNIESRFYFDDSDNILTYCWGIQNNHSYIFD